MIRSQENLLKRVAGMVNDNCIDEAFRLVATYGSLFDEEHETMWESYENLFATYARMESKTIEIARIRTQVGDLMIDHLAGLEGCEELATQLKQII